MACFPFYNPTRFTGRSDSAHERISNHYKYSIRTKPPLLVKAHSLFRVLSLSFISWGREEGNDYKKLKRIGIHHHPLICLSDLVVCACLGS